MAERKLSVTIVFALLALVGSIVHAAPLYFDYTATVDSSDRPGAPTGSLLTGRFGYDPDRIARQIGASNYYPEPGSAPMTARGSNGFFLSLDAGVVVVTAGSVDDTMTIQSFVSESANDWHMVFDFIEPGGDNGWLKGSNELPSEFPDPLDDAFLSIYFTDDFEWVRTLDATLVSVTPVSAVPIPATLVLFLQGVILMGALLRRPDGKRIPVFRAA
jgi:hypothetical protein